VRVLVLGGTAFLGRAFVDAALVRGHELTLFNRGRSNPGAFPQVEQLHGDRDGGLDVLRGRTWDAVYDTSGYLPRVVRASVELLREAAPHYTFVSSISVYADFSRPGVDEHSPVATVDDESNEDVNAHYGALKALCERVVQDVYGESALVIRPGLIVGPHDPTDRFTYWPRRVAEGGDVLAPAPPDRPLQFIDVRDLGEWSVRLIEERASGVFNATGPDRLLTMGELLDESVRVTGSGARPVWVDEAFLLEQGVGPWMELPLWIPAGEMGAMMEADISRAVAAGLTFRPITETVRATLEWDTARPQAERDEPKAGLARERERELLELVPRETTT
jgi:2'-hydroxyisoflavone reductase